MSDTQHTDLIVVGGGPAGIAAATSAAERGRRVVLLDEGIRLGGQIWRHRDPAELPAVARQWLARLARSGATMITNASVIDCRPDLTVSVEMAEGSAAYTGRAIALCVGARERFLPFPGWTLPGVVGVGGIQALLKSGLEVRGARVVVAGSGPLLLPVAALLARRGARLRMVLEQASRTRLARFAAGLWRTPARMADAVRYRAAFLRTPYHAGQWVTRADGRARVEEVAVTDGVHSRSLHCDLLCVGYGLVPAAELPRLAGCELDATGSTITDELQQSSQPGIYCAGETTGIGGVDAALMEGQIVGLAAAGERAGARALSRERSAQCAFAAQLEHTFELRAELRKLARTDTVVCRCEDVRYAELTACTSVREAKLYTRAGMGPCQGRVCGAATAFLFGWDSDSVRPPVAAATVGSLANLWSR